MSTLKRAPKAKKWLRSDRFINREYSWLQFNSRVLEEAANPANPLLERLKFLAIFESNLDEFYMVRVSGLIEQFESGIFELSPDGLGPSEQLDLIAKTVRPLRRQASAILSDDLMPALCEFGIGLKSYAELDEKQRHKLDAYFVKEIFPLLTPLILHPAVTVPFISSGSLNILAILRDEQDNTKIARVKVPTVLSRLIPLGKRSREYVLVEDLIRNNLDALFPGVEAVGSHIFRVIRDADIEIRELEAGDLLDIIEQTIKRRRFGDPVLLEISDDTPPALQQQLAKMLVLDDTDILEVRGLIGLDVLHELAAIEAPNIRFPYFQPYIADSLSTTKLLFDTLDTTDLLVHHPFDSFWPVELFVRSAVADPQVIGIKMTLYRVGAKSPIVDALLAAAEAGKQVAVMVELKARFDESNNLGWARALERAGVHVTYGFAELKTHCKLCLIVRKTPNGIRTYAHIGTGNYNPTTALMYSDIGLFTASEAITQDVAELFNVLTGFSRQREYRKLLVAPGSLRESVLDRIKREIRRHKESENGRIIFKLNSLVDPETIAALYDASEAGVEIDLIVRGICSLRPGLEGMSRNIRVVSIVGRFLEHSRILYFGNGESPEVLIGSSDLMRRNLDRRIEVLVPVENAHFIAHIRNEIIDAYLRDNTNAWTMKSDGTYVRKTGGESFSAQRYLMEHPTTRSLFPADIEQ